MPDVPLDLLMPDVPDLALVAVAPIGNSDHYTGVKLSTTTRLYLYQLLYLYLYSSLSAAISMAQGIPNPCVSRKVYLKHQVNWNTVCDSIQDLPWHNIWLADNPVEVLNEHLSLLVGGYVPTKVFSVRNNVKPWFDNQCRGNFGLKQEDHLRWTCDCSLVNYEEFVRCQVRDNETYSEVKCQFSDRKGDVLMNVQSCHKWWSTLKSAVFGTSSSLPPLVGEGGGLVCESVCRADLILDHFDNKQPS